MLITTKKIIFFLSFCICCFLFLSFSKPKPKCNTVRNGTLHFYSNTGQAHSIVVRKDTLQTEINLSTGDTSYWRVNWISDCEFTSSFISSFKQKSKEELDFYNGSTLKFTISHVTKDYYTYDAVFTNKNYLRRFSDSMWLHPR